MTQFLIHKAREVSTLLESEALLIWILLGLWMCWWSHLFGHFCCTPSMGKVASQFCHHSWLDRIYPWEFVATFLVSTQAPWNSFQLWNKKHWLCTWHDGNLERMDILIWNLNTSPLGNLEQTQWLLHMWTCITNEKWSGLRLGCRCKPRKEIVTHPAMPHRETYFNELFLKLNLLPIHWFLLQQFTLTCLFCYNSQLIVSQSQPCSFITYWLLVVLRSNEIVWFIHYMGSCISSSCVGKSTDHALFFIYVCDMQVWARHFLASMSALQM